MADVVAEVEVGVLHPAGGVKSARYGGQATAQRRNPLHPGGEVVAKFVDGERAAAVDGGSQDHHVDAGRGAGRAFYVEETCVASCQSKNHRLAPSCRRRSRLPAGDQSAWTR